METRPHGHDRPSPESPPSGNGAAAASAESFDVHQPRRRVA